MILYHGSNVAIDYDKEQEIRIQIRFLSAQLAQLLIEKYGFTIKQALDRLYHSETFRQICDPECGLYYQGAVYNIDSLEKEIEQAGYSQE